MDRSESKVTLPLSEYLRNEALPHLQGTLRVPINTVKSISTALRANLLLESEARTTALALIWMGLIAVNARECCFNAVQSAHCEYLP